MNHIFLVFLLIFTSFHLQGGSQSPEFKPASIADHDFEIHDFEIPTPLKVLGFLGKGAYGKIIKIHFPQSPHAETNFALKYVEPVQTSNIEILNAFTEILLYRILDHPTLMKLNSGYFRKPSTNRRIYMILPLKETNLDRIIKSHQPLAADFTKYLMSQLISAVNYLHSAEVIHRDIKPANIMINANCDIWLGDLGSATIYNSEEHRAVRGGITTRWYRDPALYFLNPDPPLPPYGYEIDMWSIGATFFEIANRKPLFPAKSNQLPQIVNRLIKTISSDSANNITYSVDPDRVEPWVLRPDLLEIFDFLESGSQTGKYEWTLKPNIKNIFAAFHKLLQDDNIGPVGVDLLRRLLQPNPKHRITASEALKHPYFAEVYSNILVSVYPNEKPKLATIAPFDEITKIDPTGPLISDETIDRWINQIENMCALGEFCAVPTQPVPITPAAVTITP